MTCEPTRDRERIGKTNEAVSEHPPGKSGTGLLEKPCEILKKSRTKTISRENLTKAKLCSRIDLLNLGSPGMPLLLYLEFFYGKKLYKTGLLDQVQEIHQITIWRNYQWNSRTKHSAAKIAALSSYSRLQNRISTNQKVSRTNLQDALTAARNANRIQAAADAVEAAATELREKCSPLTAQTAEKKLRFLSSPFRKNPFTAATATRLKKADNTPKYF